MSLYPYHCSNSQRNFPYFQTNADLEWKFFRAVVAEEYRRYHPIVVPFNIISLPMSFLYTKKYGDNRAKV